MQSLLKQPGYRLHAPGSLEARALLAEHGLGPADLDRALAGLERSEGTVVRTIVGINEDGVFGVSRAGWRPDLPEARRESFIPLLWVKVHELLGRHACRARTGTPPPTTASPAEKLDPEVTAPIRPNPTNYAAAAWRPGGDLSSLARQPRRPCSPLVNMPSWRSKTRTRSRC